MSDKEEIETLLHTERTGRFVTDDGSVVDLAVRGLLKDHGPQKLAGGMHYFTLTSKGEKRLESYRETLPKPKPLTRSQERYRRYLDVGDFFDNFLQFLRYDSAREKEARHG